ncbi:PLP-dependent transferase [Escherichia coli]
MKPSEDFCTKILGKLGVTTSLVRPDDRRRNCRGLIKPNTKVVFGSPGSITMEVHNIPAIVAAVRRVST